MKNTKTQYRATCAVCFKQHAVKGERMVDHGYTIPQDWHQRNGSCTGYNQPHFGTEAGLEVTKAVKVAYEKYLADQQALLARLPSAKSVNGVKSHEHKAEVVKLTKADGHWFDAALASAIYQTEGRIRGVQGDITIISGYIAGWKLAAPIAVEVEVGPTIHMFSERSREKVLCVYSSQRARSVFRQSSKVEGEVNCAGCLKALAAMKAEKLIAEKAEALIAAMVEKFGPSVKVRYSEQNDAAISEIRYRMKAEDKAVKQKACSLLERF